MNRSRKQDTIHALTRFHLEAQATAPLLLVHPRCHNYSDDMSQATLSQLKTKPIINKIQHYMYIDQ